MEISKKQQTVLREGDSITVSVSHELKIGGEISWVRYEATSHVIEESSDHAAARVIGHVNRHAMDAVAQTVEAVRSQE